MRGCAIGVPDNSRVEVCITGAGQSVGGVVAAGAAANRITL